jgi:hypothetical protein
MVLLSEFGTASAERIVRPSPTSHLGAAVT